MLTVKCLAAVDVATTADRSRVLHMTPGLVAEIPPTADLVKALRAGSVRIEGRPSPDDVAELDRLAAVLDLASGQARMDAVIAAQVRADAAALASASDAEIVASVAAQQAQPAPVMQAAQPMPRVARAPRGRK